MGTLANSEGPEEMQHNAAFHQGLHCLLRLKQPSYIYPSLVLVQPRKTCPYITERLLMGRKESNQTNKQNKTTFRNRNAS